MIPYFKNSNTILSTFGKHLRAVQRMTDDFANNTNSFFFKLNKSQVTQGQPSKKGIQLGHTQT